MRKLVYYVAVTADGFIAGPRGELDFFSYAGDHMAMLIAEYPETFPGHLRAALDITAGPRHFDTVLMGRSTHQVGLDAGLTSGYPHLAQYVLTHDRELRRDETVTLVHDDPVGLVRELKQQDGLDVWLCGGGDLAAQLLPEIDEFHLKVNPVLVGSGTRLLACAFDPRTLTLRSSRAFDSGVVLDVYAVG